MCPSPLKTSYRFVVVAVITLGLLVACANESSSSGNEQSLDVMAQQLGFKDFTIDSFERVSLEQQQIYNETVTLCMLAEGFEHTPREQRGTNKPAVEAGQTAADYADTHGWGETASRILQPSAAGAANQEYWRSLSQGEREAYDDALWRGSGDRIDCSTLAAQKVASESKLAVAFDEYGDQLRELVGRFWSDLRITTFHSEWGTCMSERGYDYASPSKMQTDLKERSNTVVAAGPYQFDEVWEETLGYETRAATASLECGLPPSIAGQPDVYRYVLNDLAASFLRDNPEFG